MNTYTLFSALAEPTRCEIMEMLAEKGKLSATDIFKHFKASPPAISQHLKVLRQAHLVDFEKQAQKRVYHINPNAMTELEGWIGKMKKMWNDRFNRLEELLIKEQSNEKY